MKRSVSLRQPRLNCTVVMSEPNNKAFRFASLASVHCHSTANIIFLKAWVNKVATMMTLIYLLRVFFLFSRRQSEDRHLDFFSIFSIKQSVDLRQPRLDFIVVMNRTTKRSVFCVDADPFFSIHKQTKHIYESLTV
jgi:hypothetical protein